MGGHLFVLQGDLTQLRCSAILVPCDTEWKVVWSHWASLLPEKRFGPANAAGWRQLKGGASGWYTDIVTDRKRWVHLAVTATGKGFVTATGKGFDTPQERAGWVADGVVDTITDLSTRDLPPVPGRVKPLIGLPLVGTGAGGFDKIRGILIRGLLPALIRAAREHDVDIALVLKDQRDHAAVQAVRKDFWAGFAEEEPEIAELLDVADDLGEQAARGELSLFLGSGVSVPLGIPDWKTLLSEISPFAVDFESKTPQQIAADIERKIGRDKLEQGVMSKVGIDGVAPAHLLLAALNVRQVVTTNYDTAYERALEAVVGKGKFRVLTGQLALQPDPWLLKYHGCINRPPTIVITTKDYADLKMHRGALQSVVESLMITSHLMFVGFSMEDEDFIDAVARVRAVRDLAEDTRKAAVATVLALHPNAVSKHKGFKTVEMLDDPGSPKEAARRLEIFLDRLSWKATTEGKAANSYLLHPDYLDLFAKDGPTTKLRERLLKLADELESDGALRNGTGWKQLNAFLVQLGRRPAGK